MYGDSSGTSGVEAKSDHTKVSSKKYIGKKNMGREWLLQTALLHLFCLIFNYI